MKQLLLSTVLFAIFVITGCKKDKTSNASSHKTVDSIMLTTQRVTTPTAPKNPGNYSVWFTMAGNNIYYANPSNTGLTQFFLQYNISANSFTEKATNTEVCACGYMSKIVSDGTNLFYISNAAVKYAVSSNSWSTLNYPTLARDNNGEAGVIYYNGKIYYLGGRTASTKFKYYDIASNNWFNLADALYATSAADVVAVQDKIFALGGENSRQKFSSFSMSTGIWTVLPDLPVKANNNYSNFSVVSFANKYIVALASGNLYVYDIAANKWAAKPVASGISNVSNLNIFSDNVNIYIAGKTSGNDFALFKITVSNMP